MKTNGCIIVLAMYVTVFELAAAAHLTPIDLLDKYEDTQRALQSCIIKSEDLSEISDTARNGGSSWGRVDSEFRREYERVDLITSKWYNLGEKYAPTPMEDASIRRLIWDGKTWSQYTPYKDFGTMFLSQDSKHVASNIAATYPGSVLAGSFWGDEKSVASILRKADSLTLRESMEVVDSINCYVIDAVTSNGHYSIWITPEYGYNIAKAEVRKGNGDILFGKPIGASSEPSTQHIKVPKPGGVPPSRSHTEFFFTLNNIHFKRTDQVWLPIEATFQRISKFNDGRVLTIKNHHKRTNIDLQPDFNSVSAFIPDAADGTRVFVEEAPSLKYVWRDGKPVVGMDKCELKSIDRMVDRILTEGLEDAIQSGKPSDAKKTKSGKRQFRLPVENQKNLLVEKQSPKTYHGPEQVSIAQSQNDNATHKPKSNPYSLFLMGLSGLVLFLLGAWVALLYWRTKRAGS